MNKQKTRKKKIDYEYRLGVTGTVIIIQGVFLALLSLIAAAFNDTGSSIVATLAPIAFFYFIITIPIGFAVIRSSTSDKSHIKQRWLATMLVISPLITVGLSLLVPLLANIFVLPSFALSIIGCVWLISLPTPQRRTKSPRDPRDYDLPL